MARTTYQYILEKGIEKGKNNKTRKMVLRTIEQFSDWSDLQIADFNETSIEVVKEVRNEMKDKK